MTEKRFITLESGIDYGVKDNLTDNNVFDVNITTKLNELSDENEQLKQSNKGLQSELQIFKEDVTHSNKIIDKLNDENEQLKKANDRLQFRIVDMLDYIKDKGAVTHNEMREWWNNAIIGDVE